MKILLDQELIITSGREVIVQHCPAGEEACCLNLFPYLQKLRVEKVVDQAGAILITARSRAAEAGRRLVGDQNKLGEAALARRRPGLAA